MEKERQAWADRLMDSLSEVERLDPSPYLPTRIRQEISNRKQEVLRARNRLRALTGALGVLVCLNIATYIHFSQANGNLDANKSAGLEILATAYNLNISEY